MNNEDPAVWLAVRNILIFVIPGSLGFLIGMVADSQLGTSPIALIVSVVVGNLISWIILIFTIKKISNKQVDLIENEPDEPSKKAASENNPKKIDKTDVKD